MTAAPQKMNMVQAIAMALDEAMAQDSRVLVLGEDIADKQGGGVFKCTAGLSTKYGTERVRSTPIAEQAIMGAAVGAALGGMKPVAEIMLMNFMTVGMDQIVNHAAKLRFMTGGQTSVPLTIRTSTGAGFGTGGQHADYLAQALNDYRHGKRQNPIMGSFASQLSPADIPAITAYFAQQQGLATPGH